MWHIKKIVYEIFQLLLNDSLLEFVCLGYVWRSQWRRNQMGGHSSQRKTKSEKGGWLTIRHPLLKPSVAYSG